MEAVMESKHLYIVLTRTQTVLSRLIGLVTNDEYTHAAISLDEELCRMYSFGRKNVYNPFVGSFIKENIDGGILGLCENLQGIIIELEVSQKQYDKAVGLLNEFISNSSNYKYNYMGLVDGLFNNEVYYNDRFLCSEFVYYILNKSGVADLNMSRNLVRPQSLLDISGKVIYKGNLREMNLRNNTINTNELEPIYKYAGI